MAVKKSTRTVDVSATVAVVDPLDRVQELAKKISEVHPAHNEQKRLFVLFSASVAEALQSLSDDVHKLVAEKVKETK